MEKIVLVKNDKLDEVNEMLSEGWKVKSLKPVSEIVSCGADDIDTGSIFAYVVLEKD